MATKKKPEDHMADAKKQNTEISSAELEEFRAWKKEMEARPMVGGKPKLTPEEMEAKQYRLWKEESKMVRGRFRCIEVPNGGVKFDFLKYKFDTIATYAMNDGEIHTIPLAVARHLNRNCCYEVHSYTTDQNGRASVNRGKKVARYAFEALDFIEEPANS